MTDIVKQLRAQAAAVPITLALDAAAEIERLRAALLRIANMASPAVPLLEMPASVARAALSEQP